jgi:hypothetical protein
VAVAGKLHAIGKARRRSSINIIANSIGEDSLLERVTVAAEERQLSQNTKAALSLLYNVLGSVNPFAECLALKFAPEKAELCFHTPHSWKWSYSTI